jgi:hypothetical protein
VVIKKNTIDDVWSDLEERDELATPNNFITRSFDDNDAELSQP